MRAVDLCPPPHLCAEDLEGQEQVVTIKDVDFEKVGEEREEKGVIFYREHKRGMVLNRTNLLRIIALHGDETDDWKGKRITLYPSEADFGGRTVPCIRVKEQVPDTPRATRTPKGRRTRR